MATHKEILTILYMARKHNFELTDYILEDEFINFRVAGCVGIGWDFLLNPNEISLDEYQLRSITVSSRTDEHKTSIRWCEDGKTYLWPWQPLGNYKRITFHADGQVDRTRGDFLTDTECLELKNIIALVRSCHEKFLRD